MKKIFRRIENRGIEAWKDGEVRRRIIDPSSTVRGNSLFFEFCYYDEKRNFGGQQYVSNKLLFI